MELNDFLNQLNADPESVEFSDTMSVIDWNYDYTPVKFSNGDQENNAGQNEGSCKIFAFAKLNNIPEAHTLHCFGKYYREEVFNDPDGDGHQNIRQFIKHGFGGIKFEGEALNSKG